MQVIAELQRQTQHCLVPHKRNGSVYAHSCFPRRVFKDTGRLLVAFLVGSVATVVGTLVAFKALPLLDMGVDGWKVQHVSSAICSG